jgi:hypothetical protein
MTTLKRQDKEQLRARCPRGQVTLMSYDNSVVSFQFGCNLALTVVGE